MARAALAVAILASACAPANAELEPRDQFVEANMMVTRTIHGAARGAGELSTVTPSPTATPQPTATPTPALSGMDAWLAASPWPEHLWGQVRAVAWCESSHRPWVDNGDNRGLMQINKVHIARIGRLGYSWADMHDPVANLTVAHDIWAEQGWQPWSCRYVLN